jgi:hypothetical protein
MSQYLSFEEVDANVANESDIEVLRSGLNLANGLIRQLDSTLAVMLEAIEDLEEENDALAEEGAALFDDAERYTLLKFILPSILEITATVGANVDGAADLFGGVDPMRLDATLDKMICSGALEQLRDEFEQQALEAAEGSRLDY